MFVKMLNKLISRLVRIRSGSVPVAYAWTEDYYDEDRYKTPEHDPDAVDHILNFFGVVLIGGNAGIFLGAITKFIWHWSTGDSPAFYSVVFG